MTKRASVAVSVAILTLLLLNTASAYLDPGTGSYVLQLLIGGLLGGLFALGIFWRRVRAFIQRIFSPRSKT